MGIERIEVFQDKTKRRKQFRWRKVASNGRIVAVSGEGFNRRRYAAQQALHEGSAGLRKTAIPVVHDNKAHLRTAEGAKVEALITGKPVKVAKGKVSPEVKKIVKKLRKSIAKGTKKKAAPRGGAITLAKLKKAAKRVQIRKGPTPAPVSAFLPDDLGL